MSQTYVAESGPQGTIVKHIGLTLFEAITPEGQSMGFAQTIECAWYLLSKGEQERAPWDDSGSPLRPGLV